MDKVFSEPAEVNLADGQVVVDCEDGGRTKFTPEAALETAHRLGDKAVEAIVDRGRAEEAAAVEGESERPA
jgi:hypothetical protein